MLIDALPCTVVGGGPERLEYEYPVGSGGIRGGG